MKNVKQVLLDQMRQGATTELLAKSIALGAVLGLIPVLGISTWLCLVVALRFRLNHVAIQLTHHVIYPLQLLLLIPYWKAGEWLFRTEDPILLSAKGILWQLEQNFVETIVHYAKTALMGGAVWVLTAPMIYFTFYSVSKTVLVKLKRT